MFKAQAPKDWREKEGQLGESPQAIGEPGSTMGVGGESQGRAPSPSKSPIDSRGSLEGTELQASLHLGGLASSESGGGKDTTSGGLFHFGGAKASWWLTGREVPLEYSFKGQMPFFSSLPQGLLPGPGHLKKALSQHFA